MWVTWSWFCSIVVQLCLCCWNFGWYGSNILILPHRLKNNAIAAAQRRRTKTTIKTSSALTITAFGSGMPVATSYSIILSLLLSLYIVYLNRMYSSYKGTMRYESIQTFITKNLYEYIMKLFEISLALWRDTIIVTIIVKFQTNLKMYLKMYLQLMENEYTLTSQHIVIY